MEAWKTYKLRDICSMITDGSHFSPKGLPTGYPMLSVKDMGDYDFDYKDCKYISTEDYVSLVKAGCQPHKGDVLVAKDGNSALDHIFLCKETREEVILSSIAIFRPDARLVLPEFLDYVLRSPSMHKYLKDNCISGSAIPRVVLKTFKDVPVCLPSLDSQLQIIKKLKPIEQKIELNNRINHNLEEQAQSVFDRIVSRETEETITLSTIADINPARSIKKNDIARCIDMSCLNTVGSFPSGWEYRPYSGGMKFMNGDTLMARITPCLENGKVAYINFLEEGETAFGSTEYIVFHAKDGFPNEMFYFLTRNQQFVEYATKNMNGSSGRQRVSGETIGNYVLPKIEKDELKDLTTVTTATMKQILKNSLESRALASMRDALLPKLMSGELNINDIDC